ncbi:unnamed protein product [Sympodiomycopsis kandeliae]
MGGFNQKQTGLVDELSSREQPASLAGADNSTKGHVDQDVSTAARKDIQRSSPDGPAATTVTFPSKESPTADPNKTTTGEQNLPEDNPMVPIYEHGLLQREGQEHQEEEGMALGTPASPTLDLDQPSSPHSDTSFNPFNDVTPSQQGSSTVTVAGSASPGVPAPTRKRVRQILTAEQSQVLNTILAKTHFPSTSVREAAARQLGVSPRKVQVWFQNVRQKEKKRVVMAAAVASRSTPPLHKGHHAGLVTAQDPTRRATISVASPRQHVVPTSRPAGLAQGRLPSNAHAAYLPRIYQQEQQMLSAPQFRERSSLLDDAVNLTRNRSSSMMAMASTPPRMVHQPRSLSTAEPAAGRSNLVSTMSMASMQAADHGTSMYRHGMHAGLLSNIARNRSSSDAAAGLNRIEGYRDEHMHSSDGGLLTRGPVFRNARPLTHQLPPISAMNRPTMGHRHSRSSLGGSPGMQPYPHSMITAPYSIPPLGAGGLSSADQPNQISRGVTPMHHPFDRVARRINSDSVSPQNTGITRPGLEDSAHGMLISTDHGLRTRQGVFSPRSQPHLRAAVRMYNGQNALHRARSDQIGLPPLSDLAKRPSPSMTGSGIHYSPSSTLSTFSGSQLSSLSNNEVDMGPFHTRSLLSSHNLSRTGSTSTTGTNTDNHNNDQDSTLEDVEMINDAEGAQRDSHQQTPTTVMKDLFSETAYEDSDGVATRPGQATADKTDSSVSSTHDAEQSQTSRPMSISSSGTQTANTPRPAMRMNPWKVRGAHGSTMSGIRRSDVDPVEGSSSLGLHTTNLRSTSSGDAMSTHFQSRSSSHAMSQLSTRLENIMSSSAMDSEDNTVDSKTSTVRPDEDFKTINANDDAMELNVTPNISSSASTPSGHPRRPPLRRRAGEYSLPSIHRLARASVSPLPDEGHRGRQVDRDVRHELDLPPIRTLSGPDDLNDRGAPPSNAANAATHRGDCEPSGLVQLPSIKYLKLGV